MGKHERRDIELLEKSVANILMNKPSLISPNHKWYKHLLAFAEYIRINYPNYIKVEAIGNEYINLLGDIKITNKNNEIKIIELKTSETEKGRGTLANITQNALTQYLLITNKNEKVLSWSEYRFKNEFSKLVEKLLDSYKGIFGKNLVEKGYDLKKRVEKNDTEAINIKNKIMEIARQDKINYLSYISKLELNQNNIKKFVFCMLNGIHTKKGIDEFFLSVDMVHIKNIKGELLTLYSNEIKNKVIITSSKINIEEMFSDDNIYFIEFPKNSKKIYLYIKTINKKTKEIKKTIGFILHWKNCFQGIETPCINVFTV